MRPARFILRCLSFLLIFALLLPTFSSLALAQAPQTAPAQAPYAVSPYAQPNVEENVPQNMHTLVQYILLEMMLAVGCQLSGIDLSNPYQSCLVPNPLTAKIGYAPQPENKQIQIGGLMGIVGNGIAILYTPTVTTSDYARYLANNFGLAKKTLAAPKDGFEGLSPVLGLWKATRDTAYFLLILAFVFIGIGVMMRLKLDPRTVMTIQNQIPRVIIAIILITFSYSIAALMTDLMWASTYLGINLITGASGDTIKKCDNSPGTTISGNATTNILASPFSFASRIYVNQDCDLTQNGIFDLSKNVANNITGLQTDLVMSVFGLDPDATCDWNRGTSDSGVKNNLDWIPLVSQARTLYGIATNPGDIGDCIFYGPFGKIMSKMISVAWWIVAFIAMIITLVRIWFMLLRAYAHIFLYVILAPMFIVINLLPKRPLGIERWLRVFFVNLAIFPVTVVMLLLSRIFMDMFDQAGADKIFVPPLIGNPNHSEFGALIAFAVLLTIPGMYSLLREKMGLQDIKQAAIAGQTFGASRGATAWPAKQIGKHLMWKDQYGQPVGPLALGLRKVGNKITGVGRDQSGNPTSGRRIPFLSDYALKKDVMSRHYNSWSQDAQDEYADLKLKRDILRQQKKKVWDPAAQAEFDADPGVQARQARYARARGGSYGGTPPPAGAGAASPAATPPTGAAAVATPGGAPAAAAPARSGAGSPAATPPTGAATAATPRSAPPPPPPRRGTAGP